MIDWTASERIALAAALSGAVHAAAIVLGRLDVPAPALELPPIAARIVPATPAQPLLRPSAPAQRRAALPLITAPSPVFVAPQAHAEPESARGADGERLATPEADTREVVAASEGGAPEALAEPRVLATQDSMQTAEALPHALPRKGRITFNLVYGRDRFPVGRTVQSWEISDERYVLASASETTGIVDLVRSQHRTYLSRGRLTPHGLQPETFLMSRNRGRGTEEARARFDWDAGKVLLGPPAAPRVERLPQRAQDLLSFMYQLALDPPGPGRLRVSITNGSKLETYELAVLAEERIETPLGVLRALPVKQVPAPGSQSVEVWLATEYRYLPVRVRFYNGEGEPSGEQIVSEIRLSED